VATVLDLENDSKALAATLGYAVADSWADRESPFSGAKAFVRVVWTEQTQPGSNQILRLAEVEVTFARRLVGVESYQTIHQIVQTDLSRATELDRWSNLASVRVSPRPEIDAEREPEKVGQVVVFSIRARVALEV